MSYTPDPPPMRFSFLAGREVSTWPEEWRLECECATYAAMPIAQMNAAIDGGGEIRSVKQIRGEAAAAKLRADIERWMRLKASA